MQTARFITVSEVNRLLNQALEESAPEIYFEGEIAELTKAASGHLYCTLKDPASEVRIILWAPAARGLKFKPECGLAVRCHGRPSVYQKTGRLQIIVDQMAPAGAGLLQKKFLELKAKLEKEGLFAPDRKRRLPFLPRAIGVVTSASGAAIHDIMVKLAERMPHIPVYLMDVRVQGEGAAQEIAQGLALLSRSSMVDVIIVGRGGGSLEDLWAFNEEIVVREIFASPVPVISAVGHEVDVSLSDLAADVRAPTPTAAAEIVVPRRDELLARILECEARILAYERWFAPLEQQVDELTLSLNQGLRTVLENCRLHIQAAQAKLAAIEPRHFLQVQVARLDSFYEKLKTSAGRDLNLISSKLERGESRLENYLARYLQKLFNQVQNIDERLQALSPRRVLERGYSIVEKRGRIVRSSGEVALEDMLKISFATGAVGAAVKEKIR